MKVQIVRAITGGLLTFMIVFCTMCVMNVFSAKANGPSSVASPLGNAGSSVEDAKSNGGKQFTKANVADPPRRKSVARPESSWLRGTKAERSRFQPLLQSRLSPTLHVNHWTNSKPLSEADREGNVVVIAFWATWCQRCIESIDFNNQLHQHYSDRDVIVVGVCHRDGSENFDKVVKIKNIQYPVAIDEFDGKSVSAFEVKALPTYFVIDKEGRLRFADIKRNRLDDAIEFLLNRN